VLEGVSLDGASLDICDPVLLGAVDEVGDVLESLDRLS
jgi:hypothetical protein